MDNERNSTRYQSPYTGEQIDEAIEKALAPRVDKFNGRTGVVAPQKGDYNADKIGFTPPGGMTATDTQEAIEELFTSVSEGKALIASAVTDKGVPTAADATFQTIHDNILEIETGGGTPENMHTITLSADPPEGGTVSGGGVASEGMTVTVSANEADGYFFGGWKENGETVGNNKDFSLELLTNRNLSAVFSKSKLPSGYQELEYIQSSRTQWIDTGVIPNWNTKIVLDGQCIEQPTGVDSDYIFGYRPASFNATDGRDIFLEVFKKGYVPFRYCFCGGDEMVVYINVSDPLARYTFILSNAEAKVGDYSDSNYAPTESSNASNLSILLFATHYNKGSVGRHSAFRLYSGKFYDADVLIRDFVPCKNPSGEIGLFDLVGEKFYGNSGSGSFIAGPAV